jgi:hypothetical protein
MNGSDCVLVACVKWGTKYPAYYVNRLRNMVARHLSVPHEFVCLTDDATDLDPGITVQPLPSGLDGWWNKIALFKPGTFAPKALVIYFDLDVVIVGPLDFLLDCPSDLTISHDALRPNHINSSIMVIRPERNVDIYTSFAADPLAIISRYRGDQDFIEVCRPNVRLLPREKIRSFKLETDSNAWWWLRKIGLRGLSRRLSAPPWLVASIPDFASVIVFHGPPKPEDVIRSPFGPYKRAPYIAQHWR